MAATLYGVSNASVGLRDGTVVELVTNGTTTATLTRLAPVPSATVETIATITFGTSTTTFAQPAGPSAIALTTRANNDGTDDVFAVGQRGDGTRSLLVIQWRRAADGTWSEVGRRGAPMADTSSPVGSLAAVYAPAATSNGVPTLFVLGRRDQPRSAAAVFYATIDLRAITDTNRGLYVKHGTAPSWIPALSQVLIDPLPPVDVARVGGRVAIFVDQGAVVEVVDGDVFSRWRPDSGVTVSWSGSQARVIALGSDGFAEVYGTETGSTLNVTVRGVDGSRLARRSVSVDVPASGLGAKWDAVYNPVADELLLYYVSATVRTIKRVAIPMSTLIVGAPVVVTSTAGTSSSATFSILRVQHEGADERRYRIALAQTLSGAETTQYVLDTSRNVPPLAPSAIGPLSTVDASNPFVLSWSFADPNPLDRQTAYDLQIQRVSDSTDVVNVTNVESEEPQHVVAGGALVNGVDYRFRVRVKDSSGTYGAWSAYSATIRPSSFGTVTITSPAVDDPAGLNTATIEVTWTAIVPGGEPTGWSLRVFDAVTGEQLHVNGDTRAYASSYAAPVPTDRRVRIEVSVISSAGTSPAAVRFLTSNYSLPMPTAAPTLSIAPSGVAVRVEWTVPPLVGSRPATAAFVIERRDVGAPAFVPLYSAPTPGGAEAGSSLYLDDAEVASDRRYEYRVTAHASGGASASGDIAVITAPRLIGAWVHLVADPAGTLQHFPYAEGRSIEHSVESEAVALLGRADPVVEYGDAESAELGMSIRIPHGAGDDPRVEWWRTMLRARSTLCYRDNRQRLAYAAVQGFTESDVRDGTIVDVTLTRVPFERRPVDAAA